MNYTNLFYFLFLTSSLVVCETHIKKDNWPLLAVVIMVKNEEAVIRKTLEPYAKAGVDAFLVFDTGSTDKTREKARELFAEYHITHGYIAQEPFVDFSTSRNRALEVAEGIFPDAVFFIMPDAEWYIQNVPELLAFCEHQKDVLEYKAYLVRILSGSIDFYATRLIRAHMNAHFKGVVHEVINIDATLIAPKSFYFLFPEKPHGIEVSRTRWLRDLKLLLKEYEKNPTDARNTFYLAQTYDCLGDLPNALQFYQKRTLLNGWAEENFQAYYRIAYVYERLNNEDGSNNWPKALEYYLRAYAMRPTRIEPLVRIAHHYETTKDYITAHYYAYLACQVSYPAQDILFVEKDFYESIRYTILQECVKNLGFNSNTISNSLNTQIPYHYLYKEICKMA